jgi:pyridinium-3,5-bisthiocarboxylic acid mononucleotide nickel chelatase
VTVLSKPAHRPEMLGVLFSETTTIGVRYREMLRECLEREMVTIETPVGRIRFKVARREGQILNAAPEFDDCIRAAAEERLPIKEVQALALKAWLDRKLGG